MSVITNKINNTFNVFLFLLVCQNVISPLDNKNCASTYKVCHWKIFAPEHNPIINISLKKKKSLLVVSYKHYINCNIPEMREKHREENAYHLNFSSSVWNVSFLFRERNCHNCSEGRRGWVIYERIFYLTRESGLLLVEECAETQYIRWNTTSVATKARCKSHSQSMTCTMLVLCATCDRSLRMDDERDRETVQRSSLADSDCEFPPVSSRLRVMKSIKLH